MNQRFYTGSLLGDFLFCKRKFYLICKGISPDITNQDLIIGKLIDEESYPREERDVLLGRNLIDFIGKDGRIHEIKRSSRFIKSHIIQLKYYLYIYKLIYNSNIEGMLNYPEEKKNIIIKLTEKDEFFIKSIIKDMQEVEQSKEIPILSRMYKCRKCAYLVICRG